MLKRSGIWAAAAAVLTMVMAIAIAPHLALPAYADSGDPAMVTGTESVLKKNAGKSNAQIVYYGSNGGWYVIAYDGKDGDGKAITYTHKGKTKNLHTSGCITLLQKNADGSGSFNDATVTNPWGTQYGWFKKNESDKEVPSRIRVAIEEVYFTKANARFDIKERRVISPRTLEGGNVYYSDHDHQPYTKPQPDFDPNKILGRKVEDAELWLLSEAEVLALPKNIVKTNDVYCLRTPAMELKEPFSGKDAIPFVRCVSTDGTFRGTAYSDLAMCKAARLYRLRPAFDLRPNDIIFTSAAVGGKESGNVGADALTPVGKNSNNEWKVTIWDGHGDFSFGDATTCDGKRLNIPYYSAAKENNGFISAIIKDAKGSIKYYGRLKEVTSSSTYGTVHIDIDGKLRKGDTLLLFNEQYNGDKKTDYASQPTEVEIPAAAISHDMKYYPAVEPGCGKDSSSEYWKCSKCSRFYSDAEGNNEIAERSWVIKGRSHTPNEPIVENHVKPSCVSIGMYDSVVYCGNCNAEISRKSEIEPKLDHNWTDWVIIEPATLFIEGLETRECKDCNAVEKRAIPRLDHEHVLSHIKEVPATCEESGNIEYWRCDGGDEPCGRFFSDEDGKKEIDRADTIIEAEDHDRDENNWKKVEVKDATCTEDGYEKWILICADCNKIVDTYYEYELAEGHDPDYPVKENNIPPTCEAEGSYDEVVYCCYCDEELSRKTFTLPKLDHIWGEWKEVRAATELKEGEEQRKCSKCGGTESRSIPELTHTHHLTHYDAYPATCTGYGNTEYWLCDEGENPCGRYFSDSEGENEIDRADTMIPTTGHTAGDHWDLEEKEPTCTEKGYTKNVLRCKVCNGEMSSFTVELDAKGHTPVGPVHKNIVPATCEKDGSYDAVTYCGVCGEELSKKTVAEPELDHSFGEWKQTKAPTELNEGQERRECARCNKTEVRAIPRSAHKHQLVHYDADPATCTENGNIEFWQCLDGENPCGGYFSDKDGKNEISRADTIISAKGHKPGAAVTENVTLPSCKKAGSHDSVIYCSDCSAELSRKTITDPKLEHDWTDWAVEIPPTETSVGIEKRSCNNCEAVEESKIPVIGHEHKLSHIDAVPATCTEYGNTEYWKCDSSDNSCGRYFSDEEGNDEIDRAATIVAPTGHTDGEWKIEESKEPTCTEKGWNKNVLRCKTCNEIISTFTTEVAEKGHSYGEWKQTKAATELEEGEEQQKCSGCDSVITRSIPRLKHTHKLSHVDAEPATCTECGNIEFWQCLDGENPCGEYFSDKDGKHEINRTDTMISAKGHAATALKIENKKEPTCTESGSYDKVLRCLTCDEAVSSLTVQVSAKGHAWGEWKETRAATELKEGEEQRKCADCEETETRAIPKLEHKHKLTHYDAVPATCAEGGSIEFWLCDEGENPCGRYFSDSEGKNMIERAEINTDAKGHTPKAAVIENEVKPTCKKDGSHDSAVYCEECGKELSRKTITDQKLDHEWGAWTETKAATETEEGKEQRKCGLCGETETRAIPKLTHKHVLVHYYAVPATCTEQGSIEFWQCIDGDNPCGRYFSDSTGRIDIDRSATIVKAKGHTEGKWEIKDSEEPTCTADGKLIKVLRCAECDEEMDSFTASVNAKGHTPAAPVIRNKVEPTCTKEGSHDNVVFCTDCGAELSRASEKDPELGHKWGAWKEIKAASELEEGEEQRECQICKETETRSIPKSGHVHKLTHYDAEAATCTEYGNTEFWQCLEGESPCGRYFSDSEGKHEIDRAATVVKAKGHTEGEWKITEKKDPTCTEGGFCKQELKCSVCDEVISSFTTDLEAKGHKWGDWKETKAATEKADGEEQKKCAGCGAVVSRSIPKLGHVHKLTHYAAENATCSEDGNTEFWQCDGGNYPCGRYFSDKNGKHEIDRADTIVKAKGHTPDETITENTIYPTCEEDGSHEAVIRCKTCGREISRKTVTDKKIGHLWKDWNVTKAATETEEGEEQRECLLCEKTETRTIPELSHKHKLTHYDAEAATCTEYGSREYWLCDDGENACAKYFLDSEGENEIDRIETIIDPCGHDAEEWKIENRKEPTCTEEGRYDTVKRCRECNDLIESFSTVIPAKGHDWDGGRVTKKPTTTKTGVRTFTCMTCMETKTEKIAKLPKKANPFKVKGRKASVKLSKVSNKNVTLKPGKVIKTLKKGYGKKSYRKVKGNGKIKINKKNGKITIKKGLKKGTYKLRLKVKARGNTKYKASKWKTVKCKIVVK